MKKAGANHINRGHEYQPYVYKGRFRGCYTCLRARRRIRSAAEKARQCFIPWRCRLRVEYGITPEEYQALLDGQAHCCAICGGEANPQGKRLSVDHDHTTGQIRGLLCGSCNNLLGLAYDRPEILRSAAAYLDRW